MAGETMELKVVVDAVMASDQLKQLNARISELETSAKRAGNALPAVEKGAQTAGAKMLILGQFVDDVQYGLRGVVNNMPQVVQAFGGGLGLAGGVGIAAVAVSQLYDAYKAYDAIQQEVASNMGAWRGALVDIDRVLREGPKKSTEDLTQALKDAQTELKNFGKTAREVEEDTYRANIASLEKRIETLGKNLPGMKEAAAPEKRTALYYTDEQEKNRVDAIEESYAKAAKRLADYNAQVEQQKKDLEALVKVNAELTAKEKARDAAVKEDGGGRFGDVDAKYSAKALQDRIRRGIAAMQAEEDARARETEANMRDLIATEDKFAELERKAFSDAEKAKTQIAKREAKERMAIAEAERQAQIDGLTSLAAGAASAVGRFAAEAAMGQEAAMANLLGAAAQAAGGQIVLEGGKVLSTGIAGALVGNPAAPGQIAGGLGLVAAGTAVQVGGPAAVQSLLGMAGGGGAGAGGAARDRGAAPRSSRGDTGGGGPLVVNVSYGVAGPLPEDTAREIAKAMRTGNRRRGAA